LGYRGFTIERLQRLVDWCGQMAKNVNVKIKKKKLGNACVGIIIEHDKVIFAKEYENQYDFENTVQMFADMYFILLHLHQCQHGSSTGWLDLQELLAREYDVNGLK
jgi:hypothetical protein